MSKRNRRRVRRPTKQPVQVSEAATTDIMIGPPPMAPEAPVHSTEIELDMGSEEPVDSRAQHAVDLGIRFRQAREERGLELDDAARQMHLPWRVLEKLESGNWQGIDSPIYLQGYLRKYSQLLGLPEPELLSEIHQEVLTPQPLVSTGGISRGRYLMQRYAVAATYLVITALIVVPVVVLGINGGLSDNLAKLAPLDPAPVSQTRTATETLPQPTVGPLGVDTDEPSHRPLMASMAPIAFLDQHAGKSEPEPQRTDEAEAETKAGTDTLSIQLNAPSWVEVTTDGGERVEYALLEPGKHVYQRTGALRVRLGNADAAEVLKGDQRLDLEPYRRANVAYFRLDGDGDLHRPTDE